jgi:hypothetical protein
MTLDDRFNELREAAKALGVADLAEDEKRRRGPRAPPPAQSGGDRHGRSPRDGGLSIGHKERLGNAKNAE